jgi:hypothetical protein
MSHEKETISSALSSIAKALAAVPGAGAGATPSPLAAHGLFQLAAAEGPYEEVIICRSLGTATVSIRKEGKDLYIVPNGKLNGLNGEYLGEYTGVFRAKTDDDLLTFPEQPKEPFDKPSHIPDFRQRLHPTKAIWKFHEGSIMAVGPANSYVIPLRDRSSQLVISIAMVITNGTGRYAGARGTISSLGATWFPYIPGLQTKDTLKDGAIFEAKGVHGFRITLKEYQAEGKGEEEAAENGREDEY